MEDEIESADELVELQTFHDNSTYKCLDCSEFFTDRTQLAEHPCEYYKLRFSGVTRRSSAREAKYCESCSPNPGREESDICEECIDLYVEKKYKTTHRHTNRIKHSHRCANCGKMFNTICDLTNHLPTRNPTKRKRMVFGYTLLLTGSLLIAGALIYAIYTFKFGKFKRSL